MGLPRRRPAVTASLMAATVALVIVSGGTPAVGAPTRQADVDWNAVQEAVGRPGTMMNGGVFRIGIPRSDLKVTVNQVPVQAGLALGSYAAFKQYDDGTMVMGDLVLLDEEVNGVMQGLFEEGFDVSLANPPPRRAVLNSTSASSTAFWATADAPNHVGEQPKVYYLHFWGNAEPAALAQGLRAALDHATSAPQPLIPLAAVFGR